MPLRTLAPATAAAILAVPRRAPSLACPPVGLAIVGRISEAEPLCQAIFFLASRLFNTKHTHTRRVRTPGFSRAAADAVTSQRIVGGRTRTVPCRTVLPESRRVRRTTDGRYSRFIRPLLYRRHAGPRHQEVRDDAHLRSASEGSKQTSRCFAQLEGLPAPAALHDPAKRSTLLVRPTVIRTAWWSDGGQCFVIRSIPPPGRRIPQQMLSRRADSNCRPAVYETAASSVRPRRRQGNSATTCQRLPQSAACVAAPAAARRKTRGPRARNLPLP
jgi:hypothetical protein